MISNSECDRCHYRENGLKCVNQSTKDLSQCLKDDDSTFYQNQVNKHSQMKLKIIADSLNLYEFIMTKAKQNKIKQNKTKQNSTKTYQNRTKTYQNRRRRYYCYAVLTVYRSKVLESRYGILCTRTSTSSSDCQAQD